MRGATHTLVFIHSYTRQKKCIGVVTGAFQSLQLGGTNMLGAVKVKVKVKVLVLPTQQGRKPLVTKVFSETWLVDVVASARAR